MNYQLMFYGGLVAALLFLVLTVFLFFYFGIAGIAADLTGVKARHSIKKGAGVGRKPENGKEERKNVNHKANSGEIKARRGRTTTKLMDPVIETTLLAQEAFMFKKIVDIVVVHSKEKI